MATEFFTSGVTMAVISVDRADSVLETQIATSQESSGSGYSSPLGATVLPGGVNFSVYSRTVTHCCSSVRRKLPR